MLKEAITLTFYDDNNEPIKEYKSAIVPWRLLKKAVDIGNKLKDDKSISEAIDALTSFVCEFYNNQFTVDDLNSGNVDVDDMKTVLAAVLNAGGSHSPNVAAGK